MSDELKRASDLLAAQVRHPNTLRLRDKRQMLTFFMTQ